MVQQVVERVGMEHRGGVRSRTAHRGQVDLILQRAEQLDRADRALLEQALAHGIKPRDIAAVSGKNVRTVQRRLQKLVQRLTCEATSCILRQSWTWPPLTRRIAIGLWIKGWTMRETADRLQVSLHRVRRERDRISGRLIASGVSHKLGKSLRSCG